MVLSNAERQKRWRQKNRVIYNLRRRNRRKEMREKELEVDDTEPAEISSIPPSTTTIEQLRQLISQPIPVEPEKPTVFRDDNGKIITESQWNRLQTLKQHAKDGGYHLDDYIQ